MQRPRFLFFYRPVADSEPPRRRVTGDSNAMPARGGGAPEQRQERADEAELALHGIPQGSRLVTLGERIVVVEAAFLLLLCSTVLIAMLRLIVCNFGNDFLTVRSCW